MANFQMTLDDNSFDVVPAGSYHFRVTALEEGFYSGKSEAFPMRRLDSYICLA